MSAWFRLAPVLLLLLPSLALVGAIAFAEIATGKFRFTTRGLFSLLALAALALAFHTVR